MPLFVWDPRCGKAGERRTSLVQTIDLAPTLLEYFGLPRPADMQGAPLRATVESDAPIREAGYFGLHGSHVNVTDGRYVYMRAPAREDNSPLHNYTLMPTHMRSFFNLDELKTAELAQPFSFTKGLGTLRTQAVPQGDLKSKAHGFGTMLFDLRCDPAQERPLADPEAEGRMIEHMKRLMKENEAPPEQYERLGLS
jgi:hypothetical protein